MAKLGMIDDAIKYLEMINPITHTESMSKLQKYKIEPYVLPGDIYSNKYMAGRGGWSWYTGSSSWYYKVCLEEVLGLKREGRRLYLPENIPSFWDKFEIKYKYKTNLYNIKVEKNINNNAESGIWCNNLKIRDKYVELTDENKIYNIEIKM